MGAVASAVTAAAAADAVVVPFSRDGALATGAHDWEQDWWSTEAPAGICIRHFFLFLACAPCGRSGVKAAGLGPFLSLRHGHSSEG